MSNPIITVQDEFIAEFSAINGTGNYENSLKKVYQTFMDKVPEHPAIAVIFGVPQKVKVLGGNDANTILDFDMNFIIECYIKSETDIDNSGVVRVDQYSLFADIYRVIQSIGTTHLAVDPKWNIRFDVPLEMFPVFTLAPMDKNTIVFPITGQIHIRNLNVTLT